MVLLMKQVVYFVSFRLYYFTRVRKFEQKMRDLTSRLRQFYECLFKRLISNYSLLIEYYFASPSLLGAKKILV